MITAQIQGKGMQNIHAALSPFQEGITSSPAPFQSAESIIILSR